MPLYTAGAPFVACCDFGRALCEAANEPKGFVEIFGSYHDCFLVSGDVYRSAGQKWLESLKNIQEAGPAKSRN
jgi:hypothetical protein